MPFLQIPAYAADSAVTTLQVITLTRPRRDIIIIHVRSLITTEQFSILAFSSTAPIDMFRDVSAVEVVPFRLVVIFVPDIEVNISIPIGW